MVCEIDDLALVWSVNRAVRLVDETRQPLGMPMVATRLPFAAVHHLLNDGPFAVVGDEKAMQVEFKPVLHRSAVDLCNQPAGARERCPVKADALAERHELIRRATGMLSTSAAHMNAKFVPRRAEAAFERTDDAGGDAGGVPVHAHHCAEGLEPERMRQARQELVPAVVMHDRLANDRAERCHALRQPRRDPSAMQGKIGTACSSGHWVRVANQRPCPASAAISEEVDTRAITPFHARERTCRRARAPFNPPSPPDNAYR